MADHANGCAEQIYLGTAGFSFPLPPVLCLASSKFFFYDFSFTSYVASSVLLSVISSEVFLFSAQNNFCFPCPQLHVKIRMAFVPACNL